MHSLRCGVYLMRRQDWRKIRGISRTFWLVQLFNRTDWADITKSLRLFLRRWRVNGYGQTCYGVVYAAIYCDSCFCHTPVGLSAKHYPDPIYITNIGVKTQALYCLFLQYVL